MVDACLLISSRRRRCNFHVQFPRIKRRRKRRRHRPVDRAIGRRDLRLIDGETRLNPGVVMSMRACSLRNVKWSDARQRHDAINKRTTANIIGALINKRASVSSFPPSFVGLTFTPIHPLSLSLSLSLFFFLFSLFFLFRRNEIFTFPERGHKVGDNNVN